MIPLQYLICSSKTLLSGFVLYIYYGNSFLDKCHGFTMVFFKVNYEYHALTKSTATTL